MLYRRDLFTTSVGTPRITKRTVRPTWGNLFGEKFLLHTEPVVEHARELEIWV